MRKLFCIIAFVAILLSKSLIAQNGTTHILEFLDFKASEKRKEIRIPDVQGYKVLKCDFHIHTIYSDGDVHPKERVKEAWREGLDVISITDHSNNLPKIVNGDFNTSYEKAISTANDLGITLVKGIEYSKSKPVGHLNFLFVKDANEFHTERILPEDAVEKAAAEGAFVIYNHPGWPDKNSDLFEFHYKLIKEGKIHGIEVFNADEFYPIAIDYCNDFNLTQFGNSDIHLPINQAYDLDISPRTMTLVLAKDNSLECVREALFNKRTIAFSNNILTGKWAYLSELFYNSISVSNFKITDNKLECLLTNNSDIPYYLEHPLYERITLKPGYTVSVSLPQKAMFQNFTVRNCFISSIDNLEIAFCNLFNINNQVYAPQSVCNISPFSLDEKFYLKTLTPDAEIYYTTDGSFPDVNSQKYTSQGITLPGTVHLQAVAYKKGMKLSNVFSEIIYTNVPMKGAFTSEKKNGLAYRYFEGEGLSMINDLKTKCSIVEEGVCSDLTLKSAKKEDQFGFYFSAYLFAPKDGIYTISVKSDDGCILELNNLRLIDLDGSHSSEKESVNVFLKKGYHPCLIKYFDDSEEEEIEVLWRIPGESEEVAIPSKNWFVLKF